MKISLHAGLVLRHGARTLELVRQLSRSEFLLEDMATRRPLEISEQVLLKRIWEKTYQVVLLSEVGGAPEKEGPAHEIAPDLASLSQKDIDIVERRREYVKALHAAHVSRGRRGQVERLVKLVAERRKEKPPSSSTVMSWARRFETSQNSVHALVSGNASRRRRCRLNPVMETLISKMLRDVYFTTAKHTLEHALDRIRAAAQTLVMQGKLKAPQAAISLSTLARRVRMVDLYHRVAAREGSDRARIVCRTAFGGDRALGPYERVEIDHTVLNWVVICDRTGLPLGRPTLTVMVDAYSGYLLGFYLSFYGPGLTSLSGILQNAIKPKADFMKGIKVEHPWLASGIPDLAVVDNGMEFHAVSFKRMAWELDFDLMYCRVRTPWLKPHVERFFGTLNNLSLVRGRVRKSQVNALRLDPQKDAAISFSALVKGLAMFAADVYPFEINERKLARPYDLFAEGVDKAPPVQYPASWDQFRLATALSKELTVSQGGVQLHGLPFGEGELLAMKKAHGNGFKTLVKWNPDDLRCVYIQDPVNKTWVTSPCRWPECAAGVSWNQHRLIRKFARKELELKGARDELMKARLRLHDHWLESTSRSGRADAVQCARYSDVTSAKLAPADERFSPRPDDIVLPPVASDLVAAEIPDFETFNLN